MTINGTVDLPHLYGKDGNRRADIERRLNANVLRGTLFSAQHQDDGTYRIVTQGGSEFKGVTLREADVICSVAMSAYNEGRAQQ